MTETEYNYLQSALSELVSSERFGAAIGFITAVLLYAGADHRGEPTHREPAKLLTVGCSVKYHGRVWEIKRFMTDSENQTIAEIESRDNGEHIIRRTMVPVEELEEATE